MSDKRAGDTDIADLVIPLLEVVCIAVLYKLVNPKRFQVEDSVGFLWGRNGPEWNHGYDNCASANRPGWCGQHGANVNNEGVCTTCGPRIVAWPLPILALRRRLRPPVACSPSAAPVSVSTSTEWSMLWEPRAAASCAPECPATRPEWK